MMRRGLIALAGALLATAASPAWADNKVGFDMWNRGDFYGAVKEWRTLAIAGDPIAQYNLAKAYQLGRGLPIDMKMAESWYGKAAQQGHIPSRDNYGLLLFQNGDRAGAMPYIEESAGRGEPRAQYVLGTALFNGEFMKKDWVRAYALMTRASAAGIGAASTSLAQMDKYIPLDQRQRGLTLARSYESNAASALLASGMIDDSASPQGDVRTAVAAAPAQMPEPAVGAPPLSSSLPTSSTTSASPKPTPARLPAPSKKPPTKIAVAPSKAAVAPVASPAPTVAKVPIAKIKPTGAPAASGWRVQLGAFGTEANARRAWAGVSGRFDGLKPTFVRAGNVVRLQAGPLRDKAAAKRACAASGTSCIAVAP